MVTGELWYSGRGQEFTTGERRLPLPFSIHVAAHFRKLILCVHKQDIFSEPDAAASRRMSGQLRRLLLALTAAKRRSAGVIFKLSGHRGGGRCWSD